MALCPTNKELGYFFHKDHSDETAYKNYMNHFPAGLSFKNLIHYSQIYNFVNFQEFDYDKPDENIKRYG